MTKKEYKEALKDGRWQIRKAEIMQRDGFTCKWCGARASDGVVLNVHHVKYHAGREPWKYDNKELITLCESCHAKYHRKQKEHEEVLKKSWTVDELENIAGKLVYIEYKVPPLGSTGFEGEHYIYLLSDKVCHPGDFVSFELPRIYAEVIFSNVLPYFDNWEFTTNANDRLKMVLRGEVYLTHKDKVEVFSGASAIELASKMLYGAEAELENLVHNQEWQRQRNENFDEFIAGLDRGEYEEIIKTLKNFISKEKNNITEDKKTNISKSTLLKQEENPQKYRIGLQWESLKNTIPRARLFP